MGAHSSLSVVESSYGEASRKTGDSTEDRLERLGLVVTDEVFVHLDERHPRLRLVGDPRLSADAHVELVVVHDIDEMGERVGRDCRVGIDLVEEKEKWLVSRMA